jgi:multiple sugar transport system substrate-binding protein
VNKDLGKKNYPQAITNLYTLNNKVYAVPKDIDTVALWYNKTLFDQAGVKYPDSSWTWDTLLENAKKLTNADKGIYGLGAFNTAQSGYYNYIFQNNGKVLNAQGTKSEFNNKDTQAALQFYTDLILKEKVSPSVQEFAENSEASFFESGHQAMGTFGSFYMNEFIQNDYVTKNCDVAILPKGKTRASVSNGLGNAVAANTKHKAAAIKFVKFLGSKQGNVLQAEKAGVIPAYTAVANHWVKAFPQFHSQVFVDSLKYSKVLPHSKNTVKASTLETEVLTKVFSGKESVDKGTQQIYSGVNDILKQ